MLLLKQVESTQERDDYWRCVSMRLLAGNCSYWLPIKKGESHLPFRQHSDTNYQAIKRLRAAMWQQQMQQRRPSDASLVSKQRKATDNKQRRNGWSIKGAGQIIAIKTGGGWRRVGQIGLLPFGHAVIHQHTQQQGLEFENVLRIQTVLPGMSSTSISVHLWRKPKQLCVFCAVWWLSREGGYLGRILLRLIIKAGWWE